MFSTLVLISSRWTASVTFLPLCRAHARAHLQTARVIVFLNNKTLWAMAVMNVWSVPVKANSLSRSSSLLTNSIYLGIQYVRKRGDAPLQYETWKYIDKFLPVWGESGCCAIGITPCYDYRLCCYIIPPTWLISRNQIIKYWSKLNGSELYNVDLMRCNVRLLIVVFNKKVWN